MAAQALDRLLAGLTSYDLAVSLPYALAFWLVAADERAFFLDEAGNDNFQIQPRSIDDCLELFDLPCRPAR